MHGCLGGIEGENVAGESGVRRASRVFVLFEISVGIFQLTILVVMETLVCVHVKGTIHF